MRKRIQILGDQISDVYIDNDDIKQNQEIIDSDSVKGKFNSMMVRAGGTGFVIVNLLRLINEFTLMEDANKYVIKYLLPDFNFTSYSDNTCSAFNLHELYDMSLKYIYRNLSEEYFHIIQMKPIDYLNDVIKPTVKIRFISKKNKQVYYRFDRDNDVQMRNINCSHLFERNIENNLVLIDYNKGYLNKSTLNSLVDYITTHEIKFKHLFLNTKPDNISNFVELLHTCDIRGTQVHIQLNEHEYEPIKKLFTSGEYYFTSLIVTRGTKPVWLFDNRGGFKEIDISDSLVDGVYTTSGCGDMFLANIIYSTLYRETNMVDSIMFSIRNMKDMIIQLNEDLFK